MPDATDQAKQKTDLKLLPEFARFLLDNHQEEFLKVSLQLLRELQGSLT